MIIHNNKLIAAKLKKVFYKQFQFRGQTNDTQDNVMSLI